MERTRSDMSAWTNDSSSHIVRNKKSNRPWACRCSAKPPPVHQEKHLYVVLDDWDKGYSIYRVGEDDFADAVQDDDSDCRQAESPVVRIKALHGTWSVAGHETKIFVMNPAESSPGIPVFDTATLSMTVCPDTCTRGGNLGLRHVYASVGDRFLSFAYPFIDVLGPEPAALSGQEGTWSWTTMEHDLPFDSRSVRAYAVHPNGRTVFMSVWGYNPNPDAGPTNRRSTYAFDMESFDWTYIGDWTLPFRGQGYYDRELDALVGIRWHYGEEDGDAGAGRVCCCDVPPDAEPWDTELTWRLGVDVLFRPDEFHVGAKLVYKGDSKFCLVESRHRVQIMEDDEDGPPRRFFRDVKMTSFVLKYDKVGDLRTTRRRGYASMWYQTHMPEYPENHPAAFWM